MTTVATVVTLFALAAPPAQADTETGSGPFTGSVTYRPDSSPDGCVVDLALEGALVFVSGPFTYAGPVSLVGSGVGFGSCPDALGGSFRVNALSLQGTDVFGHTLSCTGWRGLSVNVLFWGLTAGGGECSFDGVPIGPQGMFMAAEQVYTDLSNAGGTAAVAGVMSINGR